MTPYSGIRKMTVADTAAVHAIDKEVSIDAWSERLYVDCLDVGYECWVLVENKIVIGFGILSYAANEAHILNLAIAPSAQRKGMGEQMLQHLLDLARRNGSDEVFLEVRASNEAAKALYTKHNFVEVGIRKDYYPTPDGKEDALTLALSLY